MTCIVGIQDDNKVLLGGDSALVGDYNISQMGQAKVFKVNHYAIGGAGSVRMLNLLRASFKPEQPWTTNNIIDHMVTSFIEDLRVTFTNGGIVTVSEYGEQFPGVILVGYAEHLFRIDSDFQVTASADNFMAIGISETIAKGSLAATEGSQYSAQQRAEMALRTSAKYNGGVCEPFHYVTT